MRSLRALGLVGSLLVAGCVPTTRFDHVVVDYDTTTRSSIAKLLLLNIARARHNQPMHFTAISNVVATYRYTVGGGIGPAATGELGWLPTPNLSGSIEENPTVSISPMQGEEFTQRLLTPFQEQKLTLLLRQHYDVDTLFRLLGAEVRIKEAGKPTTIHRNRPIDRAGYIGYRRFVAHLSSIQDRHELYVEPLHYQYVWEVPEEAVTPETYAAIFKDYTVRHEPDLHVYRVTKRVNGRVMISNYDPETLTNEERSQLHAEAEEVPFNDVLVDIRAGKVGGELPLHGVLRLRSFHEILTFVGRGIEEEPEFDVTPDPRTPKISDNPARTLAIAELADRPRTEAVEFDGRYYAVAGQAGYQWNQKAFSVLYQLFQMSVSTVEHTGPAITIAK